MIFAVIPAPRPALGVALLIPARLGTRELRLARCPRTILRALRLSQLAFSGFAKVFDFFRLEFTGLAGFEIKLKRAIAHAADLLDMMADLFKHLAELAVTALDENNFEPRVFSTPRTRPRLPRPEPSNLRWSGVHTASAWLVSVNGYTLPQAIEVFFRGLSADLDEISLLHA